MPQSVTIIRVFVASPSGLEAERAFLRRAIAEFSLAEARARGIEFVPVGWEDASGGAGNPQDQINTLLDQADYAVVILGDRWGSPPRPGDPMSSGTLEEFQRAESALGSTEKPMGDLLVVFRAVEAERMVNPDAQLAEVLAFRKQLDTTKGHFYKVFGTEEELGHHVRRKLSEWLRNRERRSLGLPPIMEGTHAEATPEVVQGPVVGTTGAGEYYASKERVERASSLAESGELLDAEVVFSEAIVLTPDELALDRFGAFLASQGRHAQSLVMFREVDRRARVAGDPRYRAVAAWRIGAYYEYQGNLQAADEQYTQAVTIARENALAALLPTFRAARGAILMARGAMEEAEALYQDVLRDPEAEDNAGLLAGVEIGLARIAHQHGDLDGAESHARKSLRLARISGAAASEAAALIAIGNALLTRGDVLGAEDYYQKALEISLRLGETAAVLTCRSNLAHLRLNRNEVDEAEAEFLEIKRTAEQAGNVELVHEATNKIAVIAGLRGDWPAAERCLREVHALSVELGYREAAAKAMGNLGTALREQGRLAEARECYQSAITEYEGMGLIERAERVRRWKEKI